MSNSQINNRRDMRSLSIAGAVILAMVVVSGSILGFAYYRLSQSRLDTSEKVGRRGIGVTGQRTAPAATTEGYVGSAACVECHGEIAEEYESHPMSHSLAEVTEAKVVEDYANATVSPPGPRVYEVERRGDQVLHHEKMFDSDGELLYDQEVPVRYAVGSGQRGRSYLIDRGGLLFQSSIGWYSHAEKWDLSPGYDPREHVRFERRIEEGCLYCHSGRVAAERRGSNRFLEPPFFEAAIGCERCHGPGEQHVAKQTATPTSGEPDPTIVNPARLSPILRDSVCYQCHLQGESVVPRYGRSHLDFRPGRRLDDVWVVFVADERVDEQGRTRAVSQVEQMRSSRCFTESEGQLGCISCHDPHSKPSAERRVEHFRKRCISCHEDHGCSLPLAQQEAPPASGSCIACHMPGVKTIDVPHTALTDHRILRRPDEFPPQSPSYQGPLELTVFDKADERVPPHELRRARGLAMTGLAGHGRDEHLAREVEALLVPDSVVDRSDISAVLEAVGDDEPVLNALGVVYLMQEQFDRASLCWQRILQVNPTNEVALQRLMFFFHDRNELELAAAYSDRLLAVNPYHSEFHGRRAHMLGQAGTRGDPESLKLAIESARKAVELDPTNIRAQEWLVNMYQMANKPEEAEKQQQFVERLKKALSPP